MSRFSYIALVVELAQECGGLKPRRSGLANQRSHCLQQPVTRGIRAGCCCHVVRLLSLSVGRASKPLSAAMSSLCPVHHSHDGEGCKLTTDAPASEETKPTEPRLCKQLGPGHRYKV